MAMYQKETEMEVKNIEWSKKLYSVKEIMTTVTLPVLSRVETAYFGEKNLETFSAGQVLWVTDTRQQCCVIAVDKHGNHISIPQNCQVRFHMLKKVEEEESKTLNELLDEHDLPIRVKFNMEDISTLILDGASRQASWYQELTLTSKHDLTYLMAVCISKDTIQPDIQCLPVYLQEEFSIGVKLKPSKGGSSKSDLLDIKNHFSDLVDQMVDFRNYFGNQEIIVYPADEVKNLKTSSTDYESLIPHRFDLYEDLANSKKMDNKCKKTSLKKQTKLKLVKSFRKTNKQKSLEFELKEKLIIDTKVRPVISEKPKRNAKSCIALEGAYYEELDYVKTMPPVVPPRSPKPPKMIPLSTPNLTKSVSSTVNNSRERQSGGGVTDAYSVPIAATKPQHVPRATKPHHVPTHTKSLDAIQVQAIDSVALCKPIKTLQDLPANPRIMNITQVQECLKLLNMDRYIDVFGENCIDGELLNDMGKEILVEELGMSKLHALKLQKFIAGEWAPENIKAVKVQFMEHP